MLKRIESKKLLISIIITLFVGLSFSLVSGFRYTYMTNDDYMISLMLSYGDEKCIFLSYFLTFLFSKLQSVFTSINCFAMSELLLCIISVIIINYVMLSKTKNLSIGVLFSCIVSIVLYGASILMIQYTQTTTMVCVGGILLLFYSFICEERTRYQIIQRIIACILIIFGSLYRIESFYLVCLFSAILLVCLICNDVAWTVKSKNLLKEIFLSMKKNCKMIISFALVLAIALGASFLSDFLKRQDDNYVAQLELGKGRQYVTDYYVAPYDDNIAFYNSIGIASEEDYELMTRGYIDKDYMDADKMIAVGEYSLTERLGNKSKVTFVINQTLKALKLEAKRAYKIILKIKRHLSLPIGNLLFVIITLLLGCLLLIAIIFLVIHYTKKRNIKINWLMLVFKAVLLILWIGFFSVYRISIKNCLLLIVGAVVLCLALLGSKKQLLYSYLFSICSMGIYAYQICFRLNFRALFTFAVPAIIFTLFLFDDNAYYPRKNRNHKDKRNIAFILLLAVIAGTSVFTEVMIWKELYIPQTVTYDNTASDYMSSHSNKEYAHVVSVNTVIDEGYSDIFKVPKLSENTVLYGSWCISSDFYESLLDHKEIDRLFSDIIDDNKYSLLLLRDNDIDNTACYEKYLTDHYSEGGIPIRLVKEEEFSCEGKGWGNRLETKQVSVYRVITEQE